MVMVEVSTNRDTSLNHILVHHLLRFQHLVLAQLNLGSHIFSVQVAVQSIDLNL